MPESTEINYAKWNRVANSVERGTAVTAASVEPAMLASLLSVGNSLASEAGEKAQTALQALQGEAQALMAPYEPITDQAGFDAAMAAVSATPEYAALEQRAQAIQTAYNSEIVAVAEFGEWFEANIQPAAAAPTTEASAVDEPQMQMTQQGPVIFQQQYHATPEGTVITVVNLMDNNSLLTAPMLLPKTAVLDSRTAKLFTAAKAVWKGLAKGVSSNELGAA